MPSVTTSICSNFSAACGTGVNWTGFPAGASVKKDGSNPWPFNVGAPIHLPPVATVMVAENLKPGPYYFQPSCCAKPVCVSVG